MSHNILKTQEGMEKFAWEVASLAENKDIIALSGDLGSGKTTFTRAFIRKLTHPSIDVISPTFNLLQIYEGKNFPIWHFDLYRIESEQEITELGLNDAIGNVLLIIEWPEKIKHLLPDDTLHMKLNYTDNKGERQITLSASNKKWDRLNGYR